MFEHNRVYEVILILKDNCAIKYYPDYAANSLRMTKEMGNRMLNRKIFKILFISFIIITFTITIINASKNNNSVSDGEKENNQAQNSPKTENLDVALEDEKDSNESDSLKKEAPKARAVYITGASAGNEAFLNNIINLIKTTELNAVVLDIKEDGKVNYKSDIKSVRDIKAYNNLYDVDSVLKKLKDNDIYVIGRLVCFRDNYLARKRGDLAIKSHDGSIWKENNAIAWTNPFNREVWEYNIEIAKEAVDKGFDEIQFDYVRFPTASSKEVYYGEDVPPKADAISDFLKKAASVLHKKGALVSADIFAIVCESSGDTEGIGQVLERVGMDIDYISPMIYPSHYANDSKGMMGNGVGQSINGVVFTAPDLQPYEVVYNVLEKTKNRISKVEGYRADVRPYLQGFTASYLPKGYYQTYGPKQIKQQIKAVYDAGFEEWIIWEAGNNYMEESFK
ncbi:putative glycoside hydrolase [Herbivorax sp. ANBcel31]|uniref:putative glycoside hydrolase n=1 Tax=Herbivorax sp. ANBcel31 TaxID=3069754 RepID=UPI0027B5BDCC|nr:putative glycoside hydrolase [Herbivorax sp. ANBcel31]MDQ2087578.1 putative glycoside hydrolase [Herbivorax sp. ANBcel31]